MPLPYGIKKPDEDMIADPLFDAKDPISTVRRIGQELRHSKDRVQIDVGSPSGSGSDEDVPPSSPVDKGALGKSLGFMSLGSAPSPQPNAAVPQTSSVAQPGSPIGFVPAGNSAGSLGFVSFGTSNLPTADAPPTEEQGFFSGVGTALFEGAKKTINTVGAATSTYANDEKGVVDSATYANELEKNSKAQALKKLKADIARDKEGNDTLWGGIKNVAGNMWNNKTGAAEFVAEQAPNSAVALGTGFALAKGGAALGTAIMPGAGTVIGGGLGFLVGLFGANTLLETGGKAQEKASDGNFTAKDRSEAISEGTIKGGVITAVDATTLGASKFIMGTTSRAIERATAKTLADAGVDVEKATTSIASAGQRAVKDAATNGLDDVAAKSLVEQSILKEMATHGMTDPKLVRAVQQAQSNAFKLSNSVTSRLGRGSAMVGLETLGEGVGEYLGELAATGQASPTDAVMEAIAGLTMSMGELAGAAKLTKPGELTKATGIAQDQLAEKTKNSTTPPKDEKKTPERPANVPENFVFDTTMNVWRDQTEAEKAQAQEASNEFTPTKLNRDLGLNATAFEKMINLPEGISMLGAMYVTGDQEQRTVVRQAFERAGKLDEFNRLALDQINPVDADKNKELEYGMQLISDQPGFAQDFYASAKEYANTQPAPLKYPKKDNRKDAEPLLGTDTPPSTNNISEEEMQKIRTQMENDKLEAENNARQKSTGSMSESTWSRSEMLRMANKDFGTQGAETKAEFIKENLGQEAYDVYNNELDRLAKKTDTKPLVNRMDLDGVPLTDAQVSANEQVALLIEKGADSITVLNAIAESESASPFQRTVAKILARFDINPSIQFGDLITTERKVVGYYQVGYNRIVIDRGVGDMIPVILHEYVHAMTRSSTLLKTKAGKEIQALYKKYEKFKSEDGEYGFTDADEFIAEALTNERFQNLLKTMKVDGMIGQLWNRIVEVFSKVFGIKQKDLIAKLLDASYSAADEVAGNRSVLRETGIESPDAAMEARKPKSEDVSKAKTEAGMAGLGMNIPEKAVEATAKKAEDDAQALENLRAFTAAANRKNAADNAAKMARGEYNTTTPSKDAEGRNVFDPAIADRVAKADADAKMANAEYEAAVRKLEGIPEGKPLPEKYQDKSGKQEAKYATEKEAKAKAPEDLAKAKETRNALRQKFIDALTAGDFTSAMQLWNEYFPAQGQKFDEDGKAIRGESRVKYQQNRYNKMVEAMRWVYSKTGNKGIKRMLDATWASFQSLQAQRRSFLYNIYTNQMFAGLVDSLVMDAQQGKAKLSNNFDEVLKSPRVAEYLKTGNKGGEFSAKQIGLLRTLVTQSTINDLRSYFDAKFWDNRKQGSLDITTDAGVALKDYDAHIDFALNNMYASGNTETASDTEGEKIVKKQARANSIEAILGRLRDQQDMLYELASNLSRGHNDQSGYLIAMMTPESESFNTDKATSSEFALEGGTLDTKFNFDPNNVDRESILRMASEIGEEIRKIQSKRVEAKAELYQTLGNQMAYELFVAKTNALAAGLPTDLVNEKHTNAMRTLVVGLSVRLKGKSANYIFRDESQVWGTINEQKTEPSEAQVESLFQGELFTEDDLAKSDAQNAIRSLIQAVKSGEVTPDKAYNDVMNAVRDGQMSIQDIRTEFARQGVSVPIETINAMSRLPMRTKLRTHISRNGGDRMYFEEWMTALDMIATPDVLARLLPEERTAYEQWKQSRVRMEQRILKLKPNEEYNSAVWVFSDLLFANYSLDQMRNLDLIKDEGERFLIRSLFADPVTAWHQDIEYARKTRPDLIEQVLNPTGSYDAMVSSTDSVNHLNWMRIREASATRSIRVSEDIKSVKSLLDTIGEHQGIPESAMEDKIVERVAYMKDGVEVNPDTEGAEPVPVKIIKPGLTTILYATAPAERNAVMANWLSINSIKGEKGQIDEQTEELIDLLMNEDLAKSKTAEQISDEEVERSYYESFSKTGTRQDWVTQDQASETEDSVTESEYEQAMRETQEDEAGIWDQEDFGSSPQDSDRLRQGAFSGVVSAAFLNRWVRDFTAGWKGAPNIQVLPSHRHLAEPLRSRVQAKLAENMGAKGLYDGETGTVYLFSDYITGDTDAEFTLFHEVFGHYGMRGLLGAEFDAFLKSQYNTNPKIRLMADELIAGGMPMLEAVDEVLSDFTTSKEVPSAFTMYVGKVIAGLRKIGLGKVADWFAFLSSAELAYVLEATKRGVKEGSVRFQGAPDVIRMAQQKNPYELFATKDGKTRGYARYNPILSEWYVFTSQADDIRSGNYNSYSSSDYQQVLDDLQRLGKVEARMRSARYIDNKIPTDFVKLPKLSDLKGWKRRFNLLRQSAQNEYTPIFNLVEHLVSQGRMSGSFDLKTALTLYERKTSVEVENYNERFVKPIMQALERLRGKKVTMPSFTINGEKIETVNDLLNYFLAAEHAEERNKQIAKVTGGKQLDGSGMKTNEARKLLAFVRSQPYFAEMLEISKKLDELSDFKIDNEVARGLMTKDEAVRRKTAYKHYRNFSGLREDIDENVEEDPSLNVGKKFNVKGVDKRAMGRGDVAPDILARTILAGEASVIRSNKNLIAQKVLALFETNYDPNFVIINEVRSMRRIDPSTGMVIYQDDTAQLNRPDVMVAKVNGIPIAIKFREHGKGTVADAIHGSAVPRESHLIFEAMGKYNRFFGQLLTTYNPAWVAVNFVRDLQTLYSNAAADGRIKKGMAGQMLRATFPAMKASMHIALHQFQPKTAAGKVAKAGVMAFMKMFGKPNPYWQRMFEEARLAGGLTAFMDRKGLEEQIIDIHNSLYGAHGIEKAKQKVKGMLSLVELFSIPTELAPRLAAYEVMRRNGFTKDQSSVFSGEVTVNFNMRGSNVTLRQMYLFFNPAIQGTSKMIKLATKSPKDFAMVTAAWMGFGMLMNVIGRAISGDDEDKVNKLDKIPPLKRATSAIWSTDTWFGAIPIAYGYNAFYAMGHFLTDSIVGQTPLKTSVGRIASTTFESFSPIGNGAFEHKSPLATALKLTAPTISHPLIEWVANENRFGSPIYKSDSPYGGPKDPDTYKNFDSANPMSVFTMRAIHNMTGGNRFNSEGVDINPAIVDFMVNSYAPGVVAETYKTLGVILKGAQGLDTPKQKAPIIGRFQADVPEQWDAGVFRKVSDIVEEKFRELDRTHSDSRKEEINKEYPGLLDAKHRISAVNTELRQRRAFLERIQNDPGWDRESVIEYTNRFKKEETAMYKESTKIFLDAGFRKEILSDK